MTSPAADRSRSNCMTITETIDIDGTEMASATIKSRSIWEDFEDFGEIQQRLLYSTVFWLCRSRSKSFVRICFAHSTLYRSYLICRYSDRSHIFWGNASVQIRHRDCSVPNSRHGTTDICDSCWKRGGWYHNCFSGSQLRAHQRSSVLACHNCNNCSVDRYSSSLRTPSQTQSSNKQR